MTGQLRRVCQSMLTCTTNASSHSKAFVPKTHTLGRLGRAIIVVALGMPLKTPAQSESNPFASKQLDTGRVIAELDTVAPDMEPVPDWLPFRVSLMVYADRLEWISTPASK